MNLRKQTSTAVIALGLTLAMAIKAEAQGLCAISVTAQNKDRILLAPNQGVHITAECQGDFINGAPIIGAILGGAVGALIGAVIGAVFNHSVPFGNWGVSSNVGTRKDGHQFQGWDYGSKIEWNSCTRDFPPGPCRDVITGYICVNPDGSVCPVMETVSECASPCSLREVTETICPFYNHNFDPAIGFFTQQITRTGENTYGGLTVSYPVGCPRYDSSGVYVGGGCRDVGQVSLAQNSMTLYELDPVDEHELVQALFFPNLNAALTCDEWGCPQVRSPWVGPTSYGTPAWPPLVDAKISILVSGTYLFGDCGNYICPPCDPDSCLPCELACGQVETGCQPCPPGVLPPDPECYPALP